MYTKPAPCWEVPHPLQPSGYIPQLINPLFFISWCNVPAKLQSVCFMGTQWCHPAHNWSTQQSTELFIICINIIVKGKCFDLAETNLILLGLFCFQHFLLLEKFPRNFATSSWVRRQRSLNARNSHRNKNLTLRPGQALLYLLSFLSSHQLPPQKWKCFLPLRWTLWPWFSGPAVADERWQGWSFCMFEERICKEGTLHISQRCFRRICREMDFII